jgi:hypothetical protein
MLEIVVGRKFMSVSPGVESGKSLRDKCIYVLAKCNLAEVSQRD